MRARLRKWYARERESWRVVRERWRQMAGHEKRRVAVHGGCMAWLGSSFAHEWHAIGQADIAFLVLALVSELDAFSRR